MNLIITLYVALLFFVCVPGVVVTLPTKRGKFTTAACHAVIFALIWHFTHKMVWHASMALYERPHHEGFSEGINCSGPDCSIIHATPEAIAKGLRTPKRDIKHHKK